MQLISFQSSIAVTGTAQELPSYPVQRSITIHASSTNTGNIVLGNATLVTATTGFVLEKGQSVTIPGGNTGLFVVGTASDVLSVIGT